MKKILALMLTICLFLAACGQKAAEPEGTKITRPPFSKGPSGPPRVGTPTSLPPQ